jgi:hypothetical protein
VGVLGSELFLEFAIPTLMPSSTTQTSAFTVNMEFQSPTLSSSATIKSEPSQTVVPAISEKKEPELEIKIEIPKEKKKLTAQQLKKVLEVLRHFHGNFWL